LRGNTMVPFGLDVCKTNKCFVTYEPGHYGSPESLMAVTFAENRSKARAAAFKKHGWETDDSFIEFCGRYRTVRDSLSDTFVFSHDSVVISENAYKLLASTAIRIIRDDGKIILLSKPSGSVVTFGKMSNDETVCALNELVSAGLVEGDHVERGGGMFAYKVTKAGHQHRMAMISKERPLSREDVEAMVCPLEDNKRNSVTLEDVKAAAVLEDCPFPVSWNNMIVRILSGSAWWRPHACGYTERKERAGLFEFQEAINYSGHCGPEKNIIYQFVERQEG